MRQIHVQSNQVLAKCSPFLVSLERDLADPVLSKIPSVVKKKATAALDDCKNYSENAKTKLGNADPEPWPEALVEELAKATKEWQESASLLAAQLAAIKRASA